MPGASGLANPIEQSRLRRAGRARFTDGERDEGVIRPTLDTSSSDSPRSRTLPTRRQHYQMRRLASSAPRASVRSFSHTTLSATISEPAKVPKPQSVDAMTRSGSPTASTA